MNDVVILLIFISVVTLLIGLFVGYAIGEHYTNKYIKNPDTTKTDWVIIEPEKDE
jgi:uncharacterized protein YneF (UPF0154 family)